ncbi:MAG: DASH family cryptochrome [Proteobacteria bacterium]|nr:DASH family cryptochrome [Luminiphilus sp.]MDA0649915.1 DASH family cryptochrome [Pseudomonadota bacterium]
MRQLHWFQNDLRLADNPALASATVADSLLCVYLLPKPRPWCNLTGLGPQRDRFLRESLQTLKVDLQAMGQDLMVLEGSPELVLPNLVHRFGIDRISTSDTPGWYEKKAIRFLEEKLPRLLKIFRGPALFDSEQLPFSLEDLPHNFSPFRRKVEKLTIPGPLAKPAAFPPPPSAQFDAIPRAAASPHPGLPLPGGSAAGLRRLDQFLFQTHAIADYKQTRNDLDGLAGSSTLSPWLANGALSVRTVAHQIFRYEREHVANESTYWLYFELLWREFFHWRAVVDGKSLFKQTGRQGRRLLTTFEPRQFARWCAGDTDYPLVNALMRQLLATGWMSNRGRQIAASCLINELGLDWRYGAAFFEQQLIDYDVGSNYGNWQYLAGVGSDPRGGRHFNLEKQAAQYDPDGLFTTKWGGFRPRQPEHVVDGADWPISEPS